MAIDYFSPEYKTFRYLKSTPEEIQAHDHLELYAAATRPVDYPADTKFVWPNRVEFPEQLMYMQHKTLYLVLLTQSSTGNSTRFIAVEEPTMVRHNPLIYNYIILADESDLPNLAKHSSQCCIVDGRFIKETLGRPMYTPDNSSPVLPVRSFPVVSGSYEYFVELFYDYNTAKDFEAALMQPSSWSLIRE